MVSLSTFAEVTVTPLAAIWITPADYRDATRGTPFDPTQRPASFTYRRQPGREALVENRITKSFIVH